MNVVVYFFSALFIVLALALVVGFFRSRHIGSLLMAATYGASATLGLMQMTWWPLALGFLSAWALRLMGFDPGVPAPGRK
jgi:hypothetical protein